MSGGNSRRRASSSWHSSFSRLFNRSSSKEEEGKAAPHRQGTDSFEIKGNESTGVACQRRGTNPLPELIKTSGYENKNLSTEELSRSLTREELKKASSLPSLAHESKTASYDRQPKEGFFQFLGSLFGIASKPSWKETEQSIFGDGSSRTGKDFESPAVHQKGAHTEHPEPEILGFSMSESACEASDKDKERNPCSNLQEAQEQTAEASKKTDCELSAPAVTYATYRGSARIKQLLKKQAKQEKETPTSTNSSTAKHNQTANLSESESIATKAELSLKENSESETKYDKKDAQMTAFQVEMGLKNKAQDVLGSSDNREPNNTITSLTEMETMKNCIKEVVSMKHASVSKTSEVNRNLLLQPILLPKEEGSSCQNIDLVRISSATNRLVEKGEEVLEKTATQLQPNNATIVDFQKGMHFCAPSDTETKETIQNEYSSYPKGCSFDDDEQQLLKSKHFSNSRVDDQFTLKSGDQVLYLNNYLCSGQEASSIANESSHNHLTKKKEQTPQIISSNAQLALHEERHSEELHDVECNKTSTVTEGINLFASVQSPETIQEVNIHGKNSPWSQGTTESVKLAQINPNFTMISEAETSYVTIENFCMPLVESDCVELTKALPNITQMSNARTSLPSVECENGQYHVPCTSLETEDNDTGEAEAPVDNFPIILAAKDGSCHYLSHTNDRTLIQTSNSLGRSPLESGTKLLEFENTELISTESDTMAKPSSLQTAEVIVNSPAISAGKNDLLFHEIQNHFKTEEAPAAPEIRDTIMIGLPPGSPSEDACLSKGFPPAVKIEKNSSPTDLSSTLTSVLASNFFIFEDSISLDDMSKPVHNSEDRSLLETSCLSDNKQECTNKSAGANSGKICCSASTCEDIPVIKKSEICVPLSSLIAVEFVSADQISDAVQESSDIPETKIRSDSPEFASIGSEILLFSEETKETCGSCSFSSGSSLVKEILPVSTREDTYTCKTASFTSPFKNISKLCSPACEMTDVLGKINSFPINPEARVTISPKLKSESLLARSTTETACPAPFMDSISSDVEAVDPVKILLEEAFTVQQEKEMYTAYSEQVNLHRLGTSVSENHAEINDQAITALFTKSSNQFSDEMLKDVETGKQVQIKSQDLTVLFKEADEIVDEILYLALEEIRSKQAAGIHQTNNIKDSLLVPSLQKDQKKRKMLSESKEIQLKSLPLKHFNETCIRRSSGMKKKDTVDTDMQDETMPFSVTDKINLHSSQTVKAKEIMDDNAIKHKLTYKQQEETLSKAPSQTTVLGSETEATKAAERLVVDAELTAKLSETIKEPMSPSWVNPAEEYNVTVECEKADSLASLHINLKEDNKDITKGEMALNKVFSCRYNRDKCTEFPARLESGPAAVGNGKNNQGVIGSMHMADASGKGNDWTTGNKSDYSLYAGNGENIMTREQLPSQLSVPENVSQPAFNSSVHTYSGLSRKSKGEYGPLDLLGNNIGNDLFKYSHNYSSLPFFAKEEPDENYCEIDSEWGYGKTKKACSELQNKSRISESFVKSSSPKTESKFASEEEITGITMDEALKENYLDDIRVKSPQCSAFSLPQEWESDSSFTVLYEDALQEDSCSSAETEHCLPSLPGLSLNNVEHLLKYKTTKGKLNSVQTYEAGIQLNEMLDSTCSESFMTVEAKRCRVYPFSLSPIYEDDSSQEDLLSADISPGGHSSEKLRDGSNPSLSVLSLLQSVSERLKSSNQYVEEEEEGPHEENKLEEEKEAYIPSCWAGSPSTTIPGNVHERNLLSRHSSLSKDALNEEEDLPLTSVHSPQLQQKCDFDTKPFSRSVFYEYLQNAGSYLGEKEARFGRLLFTKDHQTKYNDLQKLGAFQVCPIDREKLRYNPRPGKMVICDLKDGKNKHEIYHDELDTAAWMFSREVVIRVVRGCWMLYEKPQFQGQNFILEEGEKLLNGIWNTQIEKHQGNFTVGSIRQVVKNCSVPETELYPQMDTDNSPVVIQNAIDNLEELEIKYPTLLVKAGVWLAYSEANYKGEVMVLEEKHDICELSAADVKSLRPLKMGGLKVQMPMNVKMVIYEQPHFEGRCKELSENVDYVPALFGNADDFQGIGSMCVIGGIWVAYEKERYKGQQYLLEEGEYDNWQSWDGVSKVLLSFRFLQADFMESEVTLFEMDEENGKQLEIVNQEIPDLDQAGFGLTTRSLNVKSGVWVAYQQKYFCGEQYILEKGKYKCFFDWGGHNETIMSIRPIKLEPLEHRTPPHWLKAFSKTRFQGLCIDFTTETSDFASFKPCSFKVLRGCWLLCYQGETGDNQCVLEEGLYTDLASCGCPAATIMSLRPIEYVFAESFISLFALENCEGRELHLQEAVSSVLNKDLHFLTQSVWVRSGQWIAYEGSNFLGKQFLLEPSKILNWTRFTGWRVIGSLRPVKQPAVYFRIKNRSQDKYLTIAGNLIDARATSVCLSPLNGKDTQIWLYRCGLIKSKVNDACLDVIGGRDVPGAKVALWVEHGKARQKWALNQDGTISSYLSDQLVLDIKGGYYYDRNHIVVNQLSISECTQRWDFEIL
ncbi:very large A-kinase anchor protein [Eublepharis macularius]|uniref:Very large A-kinase anchor protein n=1 Tax=Eublepharis macularius TaxID=481883 RepID=A0AA97J286_EUBMA|nr:very large A-kinase anchor protein [Eublepharis macularius]